MVTPPCPPSIIGPGNRASTADCGLYLHWPFCETKCGYCDFYSTPLAGQTVEPMIDALCAELTVRCAAHPDGIKTIFFGGGTPTTMAAEPLDRVLAAIAQATANHAVVEFTIEANPATVDSAKAQALRTRGVTRVSLGAQSFHPSELAFLERLHAPEDIPAAIAVLRDAGLTDYNLDLIFGVGGQTLASWRDSLRRCLDLDPQHVACYGLTYEPGTALTKKLRRGVLTPCAEGLEAEMYLAAIDLLTAAGFEHYEISNFARPGRRCRHNLIYWQNGGYIGVGPSAAGFIHGRRYKNIANHAEYVRRIQANGNAVMEEEVVEGATAALEALMMRMRLVEGLDLAAFRRHTAIDLATAGRTQIARLASSGLLTVTGDRLQLTRRGLLFADGVIAELATALDARPGTSLPILRTS